MVEMVSQGRSPVEVSRVQSRQLARVEHSQSLQQGRPVGVGPLAHGAESASRTVSAEQVLKQPDAIWTDPDVATATVRRQLLQVGPDDLLELVCRHSIPG